MAESSRFNLDRVLSVAAILFSLISLFFTWQANILMMEQNAIARQANEPDVEIVADASSVFGRLEVTSCLSPNGEPWLNLEATINLGLYTSGARGISLTRVRSYLVGLPDRSWGGSIATAYRKGSDYFHLPRDIPDGTTKVWSIERSETMYFHNLSDAQATFASLIDFEKTQGTTWASIEWALDFADGSTLEYRTPIQLDLSSIGDFTSSQC